MAPRKMLQFVDVPGAMPEKRSPTARRSDFLEVYRDYDPSGAASQSARCSQCGVPFCQVHCPLHNHIPDWLRLTAEGRLEEAFEIAAATSPLPEVCGRICPQDRLCEGSCVIEQSGHGSVTIGAIERHIADTAWERGWVRAIRPRRERGQSVGIVGAGPAGIAAADALRERGYTVDVYDRHDRAGGLLIYGIPNFKLEKHVVARRVARLADGGVRFHLGFEVGRDATLAELRARHDAVLLATGVYRAKELVAPGAGLANVVPALPYLERATRRWLGDAVDPEPFDARAKRVVVIGGGDTAMDCVRTAVRQGATSVTCLYRRDRDNMPGSRREVVHAEEEGVQFAWLAAPRALFGDGAERVTHVRAIRMRLGLPDAGGRQLPEEIAGAELDVPADLVILALGFDPEDVVARLPAPAIAVTRAGTIQVDARTQATSVPGVFAAGDIVRGASLVVWAIRDGLAAATAIDAYLVGARRLAS